MIPFRLKRLLHETLLNIGWRVERVRVQREAGRTYWDAAYLQRLGFSALTIIDVGVGNGTPSLYDAFPTAELVLIEPLAEFVGPIERILATRRGVHFPVAVGDRDGDCEMRVESPWIERSSLFPRDPLEMDGVRIAKRQVSLRTLDSLLAGRSFPPPFGLKIDAEGAEMAVIQGAKETLRRCEFVIAEVSVFPRFHGGYDFAAFVAQMREEGFAVCDILDIGRAATSEVTFFDLVFMRMLSPNDPPVPAA